MLEIKRILVPVDFSDASRKALRHGIATAHIFEANVCVAHIVEHPPAWYFPGAMTEPEPPPLDEARQHLEEWVAAENRTESVSCNLIVRHGLIDETLLEIETAEGADLVVMGTHGRRAFSRWMMGSVTEHILRKLPVPVITLSHLEETDGGWPLSRGAVLYTTDLSPGSERGMNVAYDLAQRSGTELVVLHVMPPPSLSGIEYFPSAMDEDRFELRALVSERLERSIPDEVRKDQRVRTELREGISYQSILDVAEEKEAGLIVINLHGKSRVERAFLGSTAERVIRGAPGPVLAIPLPDA